jgi:hypothetical protein
MQDLKRQVPEAICWSQWGRREADRTGIASGAAVDSTIVAPSLGKVREKESED